MMLLSLTFQCCKKCFTAQRPPRPANGTECTKSETKTYILYTACAILYCIWIFHF